MVAKMVSRLAPVFVLNHASNTDKGIRNINKIHINSIIHSRSTYSMPGVEPGASPMMPLMKDPEANNPNNTIGILSPDPAIKIINRIILGFMELIFG